MIRFFVPGEPVAQGRPRMTTVCGHPTAYDPAKSRDYKQMARVFAQEAVQGKPLLDEAVALKVVVLRSIPRSFSKKKQKACQNGAICPTSKPDLDNFLKAIKDAMTGVVWRDDSLVVEYLGCKKIYSITPGIRVWVWTMAEINAFRAKESKNG
jgi:Holliday junction resolvase RusA-like endonuclease